MVRGFEPNPGLLDEVTVVQQAIGRGNHDRPPHRAAERFFPGSVKFISVGLSDEDGAVGPLLFQDANPPNMVGMAVSHQDGGRCEAVRP